MKKLLLLLMSVCVSASLFAFDGTPESQKTMRNNFGIGLGYGGYTLTNKDDFNTKDIYGMTLSFTSETSIAKNSDLTSFCNLNLLLPTVSRISENGEASVLLSEYNKIGNTSYTNVDIYAADAEYGVHAYSYIEPSVDLFYGVGLRFGVFSGALPNNMLAGYVSMGAMGDLGLQYHLDDKLKVNTSVSLGYDFFIYSSMVDDFTGLSRNDGMSLLAKVFVSYDIGQLGL
jgi:hypothetical protein